MSFYLKTVFSSFFLIFLLAGCQSLQTSAVLESSEKEEDTVSEMENESMKMQDAEEEEEKIEKEEDTAAPISTLHTAKAVQEDEAVNLSIGEEFDIGDLTVKLVKVSEKVFGHIQPSNGKFLAVDLEMKNNGDKEIEISMLKHLALFAEQKVQDLAVIDGQIGLSPILEPNSSSVQQIIFDSADVKEYHFSFNHLDSAKEPVWTFSNRDIKSEKEEK